MELSDPQTIAAAIVLAATGIGGTLKWAVTRICKSIDASAAVTLEFVKTATKLEMLLTQTHAAAMASSAAVQQVADEVSGVHGAAQSDEIEAEPPRRITPAGGYAFHPKKVRP